MEVKSEKFGEGKDAWSVISWDFEGSHISIKFSTIARPIFSITSSKVYVSEYIRSTIYIYAETGEQLKTFNIPEMDGYQFRGLNRNKKSSTGVTLLYIPFRERIGNEWGDIEQYELLDDDPHLGGFIDIYR